MEKNPLISVIVPIYDVESYLPKCVESVLRQTYTNLEIILVDDGSPDNSGKICDDFAARDPRVRVIHKENGGLSSARNAGLDAAHGEYITFLDSDDWIAEDAYEHLLSVMRKYDVKLVCGGNYNVSSKTGEQTLGVCPKKEEKITAEAMVGRMFMWEGCDSSVCDKLFHRSMLENFRFPVGKVCEDVAVTYKIILHTDFVAMSEKPFYYYLHRADSITTSAFSEKTFHFSEHTSVIYPYIRDHYPAIANQARYMRVRSLTHVLLLLDSGDKNTREKYLSRYRELHRQLRQHTFFILKSPWFGKKEKITDLLLVLGLYRTLKPVFTKQKSE